MTDPISIVSDEGYVVMLSEKFENVTRLKVRQIIYNLCWKSLQSVITISVMSQ